jgi:hypothetical protein
VLLALAVTACPVVTAAQAIPDFSGAWALDGSATAPWPTDPPYTTAGRQAQESWAAHPEDDPALLCVFQLWRIASAPLPHEIIQQDGRLTILYEYQHQVRRIFMDGRSHPEDEYPTLMGHSIGWWEGETLVIETTSVEDGYLRPQGYPHTSSAIFTQRDTLSDDGQRRRIDVTINDPEYYREPFTVTLNWVRTDDVIRDYDCIVRPHVPGTQ